MEPAYAAIDLQSSGSEESRDVELSLAESLEESTSSGAQSSLRRRLLLVGTIVAGLCLAGVSTYCLSTAGQSLDVQHSGGLRVMDLSPEQKSLLPQASQVAKSDQCLLHVAFGEFFIKVSNITMQTKVAYAQRYGYRLMKYEADTLDKLISDNFSVCAQRGIGADEKYDWQTLLKFCGVLQSFQAGCSAVLWSDADAVIYAQEHSIDYWIAKRPDKDVLWSLSDAGAGDKWCKGQDPSSLAAFASCLNTGVFIMKQTPWTSDFLWRSLELSRQTKDKKCTTQEQNPARFDQCMFAYGLNLAQHKQIHVGDQCVVACEALQNQSSLEHYASFGQEDKPIFQATVEAWIMFPRALFFWNKLHVEDGTYVLNCAGKISQNQVVECVQYLVKLTSDYVGMQLSTSHIK
jgi:hypothetical protein